MEELPLITYILFTFNQREFVKEALLSALAQDYANLEIIVSDDASTDGTIEVIEAIIDSYNGPHKIITQFNKENLGIGQHVNQAFRISSGIFLIFAAGDNISHPNRVSKIVEAWRGGNPSPSAIYSGTSAIDKTGNTLRPIKTRLSMSYTNPVELVNWYGHKKILTLGSSGSYHRDMLEIFHPLLAGVNIEDTPLAIRASLSNGILYLDEQLVTHRMNTSTWLPSKEINENFLHHRSRIIHRVKGEYHVARQILHDACILNDSTFLNAALQRFSFAHHLCRCSEGSKISLIKIFFASAVRSTWRYALIQAILLSMPTLHRVLFHLHRSIQFTSRTTHE